MNIHTYLHNSRKKFLIFDLDKTILWLRLPWGNYLEPIHDKLAAIDPYILDQRKAGVITLSEMQNEYCKKDSEMIDFFKQYNNTFESQLQTYDTNNNLIDFISGDNNHMLFVWTSNCRATVEKVLQSEGICHCFEKIVTRDEVDLVKPEPEGFEHIFIPGSSKDEYVFIGDDIRADRVAAERAGIDFYHETYFQLIV